MESGVQELQNQEGRRLIPQLLTSKELGKGEQGD